MYKIILFFLIIPFSLFGQEIKSPVIATFGGIIDGRLTKEEIESYLNNYHIKLYYSDCKYNSALVKSFMIHYYSKSCYCEPQKSSNNRMSHNQYIYIKQLSFREYFLIKDIEIMIDSNRIPVNDIKITIDDFKTCIFEYPSVINYSYKSRIDTIMLIDVGTYPIIETGRITISSFLENEYLLVANPKMDKNNPCLINQDYQIDKYTLELLDRWHRSIKIFKVEGNRISKEINSFIKSDDNINYIAIYQVIGSNRNIKNKQIGRLFLEISQ